MTELHVADEGVRLVVAALASSPDESGVLTLEHHRILTQLRESVAEGPPTAPGTGSWSVQALSDSMTETLVFASSDGAEQMFVYFESGAVSHVVVLRSGELRSLSAQPADDIIESLRSRTRESSGEIAEALSPPDACASCGWPTEMQAGCEVCRTSTPPPPRTGPPPPKSGARGPVPPPPGSGASMSTPRPPPADSMSQLLAFVANLAADDRPDVSRAEPIAAAAGECPSCSEQVEDDDRFCRACGTDLRR